MVLNALTAIFKSVLFVEETVVFDGNYRPALSQGHILSCKIVIVIVTD